ncbi:MAG: hypothetical protein AB8G15_05410 [Saprospiraceae bacterium]
MEQQILTLVSERIDFLFQEVKNTLLQQENYNQPIDTQNLFQYFSFLEAALQLPYNRLMSVTIFINDDTLLSNLMYPLAMLKTEAKKSIQQKSEQAVKLASALDLSGIDPEFLSLTTEQHLKKEAA